MSTPAPSPTVTDVDDLRSFRAWWIYVLGGVLWLLYGLMVLSLRPTAITSLAVVTGIAFILGGVTQFVIAQRLPVWRALWYIGGVLGVAAGIATLVWPDKTLLVLAVFTAWYIAISGVMSIIAAFIGPRSEFWWLGLVVGLLQIALGVWAIGSPGREMLLLVNLIGIWLVLYGIVQLFTGLTVRSAESRAAR